MKIAVMSDSHDNIWHLQKALSIIDSEAAEMIIHCGDFVAPFMLKELDKAGIPVHGVFGNNDGDQYLSTKLTLTELSHITLHGVVGRVDASGYEIGFTHLKEVAEGLAALGRYHMVCFGHTHTYYQKTVNEALLLNPGEIMGKDGYPGFCMVDTTNSQVTRIELDPIS
jgi:putative phosphoesterase